MVSTTDPSRRPRPMSTSQSPADSPPPYSPTSNLKPTRTASIPKPIPRQLPPPPAPSRLARLFGLGTDPRAYQALAKYDTVFLIDDSSSMRGLRWQQAQKALAAIAPICTAYDSDGIDIHFFNSRTKGLGITSENQVNSLFKSVYPSGSTPTGRRVRDLLTQHIHELQAWSPDMLYEDGTSVPYPKPVNIICITDGEPTDGTTLPGAIADASRILDAMKAPSNQVGIQFLQVGDDIQAAERLADLDDHLRHPPHNVTRDMVDTVSFKEMKRRSGSSKLTGKGILKCVLGGMDKDLDKSRLQR